MFTRLIENIIAQNNASDEVELMVDKIDDSIPGTDDINIDELKSVLDKICREDIGNENFKNVAHNALTEGIDYNTKHSRITIDANSYRELVENMDAAFAEDDADTDAKKLVKKFIRAVQSKLADADEERPVDAFVLAAINKIYSKVTDVAYEKKDNTTLKRMITEKISVINKKLR